MRSISLEDINNELELISDDGLSFFHKLSGDLIHLSSYELKNLSRAKINSSSEIFVENDYLKLPDKKEINEESLMLNFLLNNQNQNVREAVTILQKDHKLNYWQLRNVILHYKIGNEWYKYKREAFQKIAIEWCNKNIESMPHSILQEIQISNNINYS